MARKKSRKGSSKKKGSQKSRAKISKKGTPTKTTQPSLSDEVKSFIVGLLFVSLAVLFIVSKFGQAGPVGDWINMAFTAILGFGYYLLPILLIILALSFFHNVERNFSKIKILGSALFLVCGLGFLQLVVAGGGFVGSGIAMIENFVGKGFAIFLTVIGFASALAIIFDVAPKVPSFNRRERSNAVEETSDLNDQEEKRIERATAKATAQTAVLKNQRELPLKEGQSDEEPKKPLKNFLSKKEQETVRAATKPKEKTPEEKLSAGIDQASKKAFAANTVLPPIKLLSKDKGKPGVGDIKENANTIKRTLSNFGIEVEMDEVAVGPTVTRYSFKPAQGVKLSKIAGLQDDLALTLAAKTLRMETPIPGKSLVGIEIPNKSKTMVGLGSLLGSKEFLEGKDALPMAVGKDISGNPSFINLAKAPHMLIAGATGAGKSVTVHALITSLLYRHGPDMLKFIMIDPKRVEMTLYNGIPHQLTPTITDPKSAILALKWAVKEMNRRYDVLQEKKVRDIGSYHKTIRDPAVKAAAKNPEAETPETMPYIVIVIDELADIMMSYPRELEAGIVALAQMSRAVGIHLIISTQRPSVNVITGLIKANIPTRIALKVSSAIDSRTILDAGGAERLLGAGDALYQTGSMPNPVRVQSSFIPEEEVKAVVEFLKKTYKDALPDEIDLTTTSVSDNVMFAGSVGEDDVEDDLFEDAKATVLAAGKASTSYLQRKLRVGYSRAARLMDILEEQGVIGPANGSKPREVLIGQEEPEDHVEDVDENDMDLSDNDVLTDEEPDVYTPPTNERF